MKRPPVLDAPPAPRRKRALSAEELALWESVARQARPLRKKPRPAKVSAEVAPPPPTAARPVPAVKLPAAAPAARPAPPPLVALK